MLRGVRTAAKYFAIGAALGLFFAPRSGEETRQEVINWARNTVGDLMSKEADMVRDLADRVGEQSPTLGRAANAVGDKLDQVASDLQ
ncbi:MAG: hypothetical protein DLM69_09645 [Candidatus Chloroheliales bacterium]|nr:MAG: hypothetical protein DLM69_09645 [Chloroflexota bacterium]